jgi:diguanylate cyclase (GGDEF)-like protein
MLDIDLFKAINDKYGHAVGDLVLQEFSGNVKSMIRKSDFFARWGGEEFFIVLPNTNQSDALLIVEKLRSQIEKTACAGLAITVSAGVAEYSRAESLESILKRVDAAVYKAKDNGRNRIELAWLI